MAPPATVVEDGSDTNAADAATDETSDGLADATDFDTSGMDPSTGAPAATTVEVADASGAECAAADGSDAIDLELEANTSGTPAADAVTDSTGATPRDDAGAAPREDNGAATPAAEETSETLALLLETPATTDSDGISQTVSPVNSFS